MCIDMCADICIAVPENMHIRGCIGMHADMCTDMCADTCAAMCIDVCVGTFADMCAAMCVDMRRHTRTRTEIKEHQPRPRRNIGTCVWTCV